jgi:hypothetical protein
MHLPLRRGCRQFAGEGFALREETYAGGGQSGSRPTEQSGQRGECPSGYQGHIGEFTGFDTNWMDGNGASGRAGGFAKKNRLSLIGFDKMKWPIGCDREHYTRQSAAGAEIHPERRICRYERGQLQRIVDMSRPDMLLVARGDEVYRPVPLQQKRRIDLQSGECFT